MYLGKDTPHDHNFLAIGIPIEYAYHYMLQEMLSILLDDFGHVPALYTSLKQRIASGSAVIRSSGQLLIGHCDTVIASS